MTKIKKHKWIFPARFRTGVYSWKAMEDDGVDYLGPVGDHWGEICASTELAGRWADELVPQLRANWSGSEQSCYFRGTTACLSCLLVTERYQELFDLLELDRYPSWHYRRYGLGAAVGNSYIARFRAVAKRYPMKDKSQLLADLIATTPGKEGKAMVFVRQSLEFGAEERT